MDTTTAIKTDPLPDARLLAETRERIREMKQAVWNLTAEGTDEFSAYRLGGLEEALEVAGDALFRVLNQASSMCDSKAAAAAIKWGSDQHRKRMIES
jgi:hypothetical protein